MIDNLSYFKQLISYALLLTAISFFSCKSTQSNSQMDEVKEQPRSAMYSDKITVTGTPELNPQALEKKYEQYVLQYKGLMSKSMNKMMFKFDDTTITNSELCKILIKDEDIIKAESLESGVIQTGLSKSSDKQVARPVK